MKPQASLEQVPRRFAPGIVRHNIILQVMRYASETWDSLHWSFTNNPLAILNNLMLYSRDKLKRSICQGLLPEQSEAAHSGNAPYR